MEEERLTKQEKKELRKEARLSALGSRSSQNHQKFVTWGVIAVAAILFLGFFSLLVYSAKKSRENVTIAPSGWARGDVKAKNILFEFGDFQCPACKNSEPMVQQVVKDFKGKLKFIYKHFPLTQIHKNAMNSAVAAEAAGKQGKFWEMHDILYAKQDEWAESNDANSIFVDYAKELKLDVEKFKNDLKDQGIFDKVKSSQDEAISLGVNSTPTFILNNKQIDLTSIYQEFKKEIEKNLK